MRYYVYWIHYPEHTDSFTEGYVGYTDDLARRFALHRQQIKNGRHSSVFMLEQADRVEDLVMDVLAEGPTAHECRKIEFKYRPDFHIGWNRLPGGGGGGYPSEETRLKMRLAKLGKPGNGRGKPRPHLRGKNNPACRPEVRAILREQKLGDKNPAKRPEVRKKIGDTQRGVKKPR